MSDMKHDIDMTYQEMKNELKRNETLTKIVQMLGVEEDFDKITTTILQLVGEYIKVTNVCLYQVGPEALNGTITVQWASERKNLLKDNISELEDILLGEELKAVSSHDIKEQDKKRLENCGIYAYVSVPVIINDKIAMYLLSLEQNSERAWELPTIKMINDTSKIIQSIAQRKVTRNSLYRSYGALTEILDNMGCGVIVLNKETKTVLFENKVASASLNSKVVSRECMERMYKGGSIERKVEKFDATTGVWYEIDFSDITWVDGRDVCLCTILDITQTKKNQQKIEFQANNDFLTGLYNRMKCDSDLRKMIEKCKNENTRGAVLFLDLDDFKHINDGLGHQYGDILLQEIASGLRHISGIEDTCYRMGGDEFVIIISPEEIDRVNNIISDILVMFNKPWYLYEAEYYCTMSMGVVCFPDNGNDVNELIKKADIAMYDAKKAGKNRCSFYKNKDDKKSFNRLDIENSMRNAIASNCREFEVYYQPIIDNKNGSCIGCEALVRWNSRTLGFLTPDTFIPLAEYLGLITNIGDYVFEKACIKCREWNENGYPDFQININLSVIQLLQNNVVENIEKIVKATGINTKNLFLEITETLAINDMERVMKIISRIRKLGIGIALDDFGSGYSSLNYIKKLPLDIIKVDRSFIKDIKNDEYAQAFVKLICELSKIIGVKVCVEGVETEDQRAVLREMDVDLIQGYFYGTPTNAEKFEKIFLKKIKRISRE